MPYGHNGRILYADLTKVMLTVEEPDATFYLKYRGGSAMGIFYILPDMPKGGILSNQRISWAI